MALIPSINLRPNFPIVISGYTVTSHLGTYYKRTISRLSESLIKFDLPHLIYPMQGVKNWAKGCGFKARIISHALRTFNHPVLWIDADGEVFKYPQIFEDARFDMALCTAGGGHWLTGTLYMRPTIKSFVQEWVKVTESKWQPDEITLLNLHRNKRQYKFKLEILPGEYNKIVHSKSDKQKIVIGHYIRPDVAPSRNVKAVKI